MHTALWVLAAVSLHRARSCACCARATCSVEEERSSRARDRGAARVDEPASRAADARPPHTRERARRRAQRAAGLASASLRIGDVARLVGTTPRTIRYYEEIGLLPEAPARPSGSHRIYTTRRSSACAR